MIDLFLVSIIFLSIFTSNNTTKYTVVEETEWLESLMIKKNLQ